MMICVWLHTHEPFFLFVQITTKSKKIPKCYLPVLQGTSIITFLSFFRLQVRVWLDHLFRQFFLSGHFGLLGN